MSYERYNSHAPDTVPAASVEPGSEVRVFPSGSTAERYTSRMPFVAKVDAVVQTPQEGNPAVLLIQPESQIKMPLGSIGGGTRVRVLRPPQPTQQA